MKTELAWAKGTLKGYDQLLILPEGWGTFDCERLEVGDRINLTIGGQLDCAACKVVGVAFEFGYNPIDEAPFGSECDCLQWVTIALWE